MPGTIIPQMHKDTYDIRAVNFEPIIATLHSHHIGGISVDSMNREATPQHRKFYCSPIFLCISGIVKATVPKHWNIAEPLIRYP